MYPWERFDARLEILEKKSGTKLIAVVVRISLAFFNVASPCSKSFRSPYTSAAGLFLQWVSRCVMGWDHGHPENSKKLGSFGCLQGT